MTNYEPQQINIEELTKQVDLYRDIILLYCPDKVGSTSIVSSIRFSAPEKFMVFHTHEEKIADLLYVEKNKITIEDILSNNNVLNPNTNLFRQIYLIDIYRDPIEKKISSFFQKISEEHFNNTEENLSTYPIEKITKRFNDIFPYIDTTDYYNSYYTKLFNCSNIKFFDIEKKFHLEKISQNITLIKLRLNDSKYWSNILSNILNTDIIMLNEYDSTNKKIGKLYNEFKKNYQLPFNYFETLLNLEQLNIYLSVEERQDYLSMWFKRTATYKYKPFDTNEYEFYKMISIENRFYNSVISNRHYSDDGCLCKICVEKRKLTKQYICCDNNKNNGDKEKKYPIYIIHKYDMTYCNYIFLELIDDNKNRISSIINLVNF